MVTRNSDMNLIVRARTEGEKLIESLSDTLRDLLGDSNNASTGLAELGAKFATLDKALGSVNSTADKAEAAFNRQKTAIVANKAELAELEAQAEAARRAIANLNGAESVVAAGRNQGSRLAQIKAAQAEQTALDTKTAKLTRTIQQQEAAIDGSQSSLQRLGSASIAISAAQAQAAAQIQNTTQQLNEQAAAAERVSDIQRRINDATGVSRPSAKGSAAAAAGPLLEADNIFRQNEARAADAAQQELRDIQRLRNALDPLAAVQKRFNDELSRYRALAAAGKITTDELAAAEKHLAAEAKNAAAALGRQGNGKLSLFGLKPYELQNLGYQVNDVVTQLASGTNLSQVLAQQGGQILQLFPKVGGAIVAALSNPAILAGVATIGLLVAGLARAADEAERLRHYTAQLSFRADGDNFKAADLSAQEHALRRLGASAEDARSAITAFLNAGLAPDRLNEFAAAALQVSEALGIKLPDAAKQLAEAFTGGFEAVAALDDKLNFLTATEREHIREMFESGRAAEARTEAFRLFESKAEDIATKSRGDWSMASRDLGAAWSDFMDAIASTWLIDKIKDRLLDLASGAKYLAEKLREASGAADPEQAVTRKTYADQLALVDKALADTDVLLSDADLHADEKKRLRKERASLLEERAFLRKEVARLDSDPASQDPDTLRGKRRASELSRIEAEEELQALRSKGQSQQLSAQDQARRLELAGLQAARGEADEVVAAALKRRAIAAETAAIEKEAATRRRAADRDDRAGSRNAVYGSPLPGTPYVTARYREQRGDRRHEGLDLRAAPGTPVFATQTGTVGFAGLTKGGYGNLIKLDHGAGAQSRYGHLRRFVVKDGQVVEKGQLIGYSGGLPGAPGAGNSRAPHLHYELRVNGKPVDPGAFGKALHPFDEGAQTAALERKEKEDAREIERAADEKEKLRLRNLERQSNFDRGVKLDAQDSTREIDARRALLGLSGEALLDAQRRLAVQQAEVEYYARVEQINSNLKEGETPVLVDPKDVENARAAAGALFDVENAKNRLEARVDAPGQKVSEYQAQIAVLRQQADLLREVGDFKGAEAIEAQIDALSGKLRDAVDKLIAAYEALSPAELATLGLSEQALATLIAQLQVLKAETQEWGQIAGISAKDVAQAFASQAAQSFTNFLRKVSEGENIFKSLGESVLEFAANFASAVAQMILQLLAYAAAVAILRALGVPVPAGGGLFGGGGGGGEAPVKHGGGIVGAGGQTRNVNPAIFAGAMRFHTGGIAGLRPDEVGIIAKRDEEVLTSSDPRHRNNGGSGGGKSGKVSIFNLFDPAQVADMMLRTPAGEKALLNIVSENKGAFKAALS